MRFYFDFATYFQLLRLARLEQNPTSRRRLFVLLLVVLPLVSSFHALCFFLDPLLFPGLRRVRVDEPVFLVGHARSGTTLMHRMLCRDAERFSAFLLYELFFPSLLQKKLIRRVARLDQRFLGGWMARKLAAWDERKFAATQDIHRMSLTQPEEDDFVLTLSVASGYWIVMFPYMGLLDFYYVDQWPEKKRRRMMSFYRECVRRQLYLNGRQKVHLSKNPTFCGRIESLLETFPDARIVVLVRNPYETVPSLLKLMQTSWKLRHFDDEEMRSSLEIIARQSYHSYTYPLEVLKRHPEVPQAVVDYRELVARPRTTVEEVYGRLGLPVTDAYREVLQREQERAGTHETSHRYSLEEFGLAGDEIRRELADLFERFGWDRDAAGAGGA